MCLTVKEPLKIASKDIVCYKIMKIWIYNPVSCLVSFFRGSTYLLNTLYTEKRFGLKKKLFSSVHYGLHSYATAKIAKESLEEGNYRSVLVKCIIPKGAYYYVGNEGDYCSNQLKTLYIPANEFTTRNHLIYGSKTFDSLAALKQESKRISLQVNSSKKG